MSMKPNIGTSREERPRTKVRAKTTGDYRSNLLMILLRMYRPRMEPLEHQNPSQRLN